VGCGKKTENSGSFIGQAGTDIPFKGHSSLIHKSLPYAVARMDNSTIKSSKLHSPISEECKHKTFT
jgi:hypothetical protein